MKFLSYAAIVSVLPLPTMSDDWGVAGCVVLTLGLAAGNLISIRKTLRCCSG
jgi:hypothetical protein